MATERRVFGLDMSKYPARMGKPWSQEEIKKLLSSIHHTKPIAEIALEHERTEGSIESYRRKLAADYHFNDNRPIEEIQAFTGLTREQVEDSIKRRSTEATIKRNSKQHIEMEAPPDPICELQSLKKEVAEMKKDIKQILFYMTSLYEFETSN